MLRRAALNESNWTISILTVRTECFVGRTIAVSIQIQVVE